jgi:imidazole glycerol-phosphate synthase subunit HisH
MITIIDYGMGNLRSVEKAFEFLGYESKISKKAEDIKNASSLILPGVGAFGDAMKHLKERGLIEPIKEEVKKGKPFLGICLGMQLLFEKSLEHGEFKGLGLVKGEIIPFKLKDLKVPHMGWNNLIAKDNPLFKKSNDEYVYFVHSFFASNVDDKDIIATSVYGKEFVAAVKKDNVYGLQFHPEKSGEVGLAMLKEFGKL